MGRVRVDGPDADALTGAVQCLDTAGLAVGRVRYSLMLNAQGGIVDDVLVGREAPDRLLFVVNAGNREADVAVFRDAVKDLDATVSDDSDAEAMIAIQGPRSPDVLRSMGLGQAAELKYYRMGSYESEFGPVVISRTGYTGEVGFEVIVSAERVRDAWNAALANGAAHGIRPCGLGARDTLRLEAGMPLHGQEIGPSVNPYEAGLDFAVRSDRDYVGRAALEAVRAAGPARALVGMVVDGPRIARTGSAVLVNGEEVGAVCSGTLSPTLELNIATAMIDRRFEDAEEFTVRIRKHEASARKAAMPFYRRPKE